MSRENKVRHKSNTVRVAARQRNHDNYSLPAELTHLSDAPLYCAVAYFALLQQRPVSRQQICCAFHISTRRAVEVMRYLTGSDTPHVACERLPPISGEREQGYRIHVHAIAGGGVRRKRRAAPDIDVADNPAPVPPSGESVKGHRRVSRKANEQTHQKLRSWFLQRPNPDAIRTEEQDEP
ncbi:CaiF/GrlA family transcriptional regulator [Serratia bockelmannii]|uniref:CaiF/GrlA family transcriptional regulator n=1 Tax=Serratia bockelmannii TaxID=2703793 RepID=UPI00223FDB2C|nr:CaiF/GrlA family transcriptional regulator [Serratia bockelmannii]MCW7649161.1 CaiF/GrlA family transcriptional regulator [Serratia bockelmannii]MCW7659204.1 CaiF/GrlA family transcriptional regulator [Serratia bockelmannii]MCW7678988.1 CaiF/GrlA family transcriptional regulator [Serratia bockelmannii]MCW7683765.1 CaiF/GrlA family transcriptional regulator [Serratia bockelmannii]MCW7688542.1 CaiF/GrlA family transcriptional regulator [Serratia bockelmannii]